MYFIHSCFCTFPTARFYLSTLCSISATLRKLLIGKKAVSQRSFFHYLSRSSYCRQWFQDYLRLRWGTLLLVCFHSSFRNISEYRVIAYIQRLKGFCTGALPAVCCSPCIVSLGTVWRKRRGKGSI